MNLRITFLFLAFVFGATELSAQVSSNCTFAIPICNNTPVNGGAVGYGTDDFNGAAQTGCLELSNGVTIESNSAWYHFKTRASGQLGFNISFDSSEDWDFALYKSTDCANLGEPIRCNFFDNSDESSFVGVGETATNIQYEDWLEVAPGEDYYLLVNNFSDINSGFSIQFTGSIFVTNPYDALDCAIITNLLGTPIAACEGDVIVLDATTIGATMYEWFKNTGGGFMPIVGENNATLEVVDTAFYSVRVIQGNAIYSDVRVVFSAQPRSFPMAGEIFCANLSNSFDLSTKNNELLGNQDPSEFMVSYYATAADANDGENPLPLSYTTIAGIETIYTRVSALLNPECYTVAEQFQLTTITVPEIGFYTDVYLCGEVSITIGDSSPNPNYTYLWDSGETLASIAVSQGGVYEVTITNHEFGETCEKIVSVNVVVSTAIEMTEIIVDDLKNNNTVTIVSNVDGNFEYQLDDGSFQQTNVFEHVFPGEHTVTINDLNGCNPLTENIVVVGFSKFFSPNGDSVNDLWEIRGIEYLNSPIVTIFDQYGTLLFQSNEGNSKWNGTYNEQILPATDYWFKLSYVDSNEQRVDAKYIKNHFSLRR